MEIINQSKWHNKSYGETITNSNHSSHWQTFNGKILSDQYNLPQSRTLFFSVCITKHTPPHHKVHIDTHTHTHTHTHAHMCTRARTHRDYIYIQQYFALKRQPAHSQQQKWLSDPILENNEWKCLSGLLFHFDLFCVTNRKKKKNRPKRTYLSSNTLQ